MKKFAIQAAALSLTLCAGAQGKVIDLAGKWDFGYGSEKGYGDTVTLPGSMLTNGKGNDVDAGTKWTGSLYDLSYYHSPDMEQYRRKGNIKFPFFLTPDKEYVGEARYRRTVKIPKDWKDRRTVLFLERPHIETTVSVNGKETGHDMSLSTPHEYDITEYIVPGRDNTIEIKVYNGVENVAVGADSHSVTDQTQGNWNGIVGKIQLKSTPRDAYIRNVRVYPDAANHKALVRVIRGGAGKTGNASVTAVCEGDLFSVSAPSVSGDTLSFTLDLGNRMKLWDEFRQPLYSLTAVLGGDTARTVFGMRDISVRGRDIVVNGRPAYMRGTVESCCFPLTGYPPTDEESWAEIFAKCREFGINMVRFHSYCPPEAAFSAADKAGVYLQPEGPSWPNHEVSLNAGMSTDQYILDESRRILDTYGNHPSFVMMAAGNEPGGDWVPYTDMWVREMKKYDPGKIYCGASVGGGWAWDGGSEYHVKGGGRGLTWKSRMPSSDDDYTADILKPRNFKPTEEKPVNTAPVLAHEQGQWCVFPDLSETAQYTGPYKARNFEFFRDLLVRNGMEGMGRKFLDASGKLQALCYKYEIERNLRTPGYSGFQLLGLNDYSGQGSAIEGVLNVFWREKPYISAPQWRRFCSEVVPLARFPRFVFSDRDTLTVPVEVYNASASAIRDAEIAYSITDDKGAVFFDGTVTVNNIPVGKNNPVGAVSLDFAGITRPTKFTMAVDVAGKGRNSWEFWVYPHEEALAVPAGIHVADTLDEEAIQVLRDGGKVLLTAAGKVTLGSDITQYYLPVFWNTSWFKMRPPHTTGAYIDTSHPLFRRFKTDNWGNLNWWELLNRAQVINLLELPAAYQSPVQPIDTWHLSRKLGMIVEANVLNGKLFLTTLDICGRLDKRPVAMNLRNAVLRYLDSPDFAPALTLSPETVSHFFTHRTPPVKMYTDESPDELKPKIN